MRRARAEPAHDRGDVHATRLPEGAVIRTEPLRTTGGRDVPLRPPDRVVGRTGEIAALEAAVAAARAGGQRALVVGGPGGMGTSALVQQVHPLVRDGGWFVAGGYDRYRRDAPYHGVRQALRQLGWLLLAEPEEERPGLRRDLRRTLGPNLDLAATVVPELATLLELRPRPPSGDGFRRPVRLQRAAVDLLRVACSRRRPVVFAVDDLQWADATALGLLDHLLLGEPVEGLVTVAAYRADELHPDSPLAAALARWCRPDGPAHLRLTGLDTGDLTALVGSVLRLDRGRAADLAALVAPHVAGNPLRTLEVLDALRRAGVLAAPDGQGWRWDPRAVRHHLATSRPTTDLVSERLGSLPPATVEVLAAMACLGGRVELPLLAAATGAAPADLRRRLAPALGDGLLVPAGGDALRFRHDVVRETVLRRAGDHGRRATRLALARRLGRAAGPPADADTATAAAQLYLPVVDEVRDPAERHAVAGLFRRAAGQAELLGDHATTLDLLDAAVPLVDPHDASTLADVHTHRHAALCGLGRLDEADAAFEAVGRLDVDPQSVVDVTLAQIDSLAGRGRHREAVELGTHLLRRLGVVTPAHERLDVEIERGLAAAYQWLATPQAPEPGEAPVTPTASAVAAVIDRMLPSASVSDELAYQWLALTALRMWAGRGPHPDLVGPVSHVPGVLLARRQDHRVAVAALRRVLAVSEARGYEPAVSQAHLRYAMDVGHWFEPLDHGVAHCRRARDGLLAGGDPAAACTACQVAMTLLMEYAPSVDRYAEEVEASLAFARQVGDDVAVAAFQAHRDLVDRLRGTGGQAGGRPDVPVGRRLLAASHHLTLALGAALFDDPEELDRQTSALMSMRRLLGSTYLAVQAHLLRALALAERVRTGPRAGRGATLGELDRVTGWLADRAERAPANLRHLRHLVEAEQAWAVGDVRTALACFDAAVGEAAARQRPWHLAYALERAGRFHLAHGAAHTGATLLAQAREQYLRWGAAAKVAHLDRASPGLADRAAPPGRPAGGPIPAGGADPSTLLATARQLGAPTTPEGVHERLVEILSEMTGATHVHLLVRAPDGGWVPAAGPPTRDGPAAVPASVAHHVDQTGEPLVVSDATRDERFADDPYLADLDRCSVLAVPVGDGDRPDAVLVLENRQLAGAFTPALRDAVTLIAAQVAISLHGARRYRDLERRMDERGAHLADATRRLARLGATDPLTGLANRRRLEEALAERWAEAQVTGEPVALAMIDIDSFKLYNDTYGHAAGDRRLQEVAAALRGTIRGDDLAARYDGEEFAVLMPRTDLRGASAAAERIRAAVAEKVRRGADAVTPPITVSIGVASAVPLPGEREHGLVELADGALHGAKRDGGDRVRWAPAPRP
ncbi:MAG TPA: diguanylate cyclase [Natronosporangium sp.]|jgi:diguanylate cyclase (GGDEF)-like protein